MSTTCRPLDDRDRLALDGQSVIGSVIAAVRTRYPRWNYIERSEIESCCQLFLLRAAETHDPSRGDFAGYAYRCLLNHAIDQVIRANRDRQVRPEDQAEFFGNVPSRPASEETPPEIGERLGEMMACLSDRQRSVVERLYGLGGRDPESYREIADAIGGNEVAARRVAFKAMRKLRLAAQRPEFEILKDWINR